MSNLEQKEKDFRMAARSFTNIYPIAMLTEFGDYWTEPNKSGTKLRWELERTWHLGRRLARWATHSKVDALKNKAPQMEAKEPTNDFERLDVFMSKYLKHPTGVKFEDFGKWYDFMKSERLLKTFTKGEVEELKTIYGDNGRCRSACVQKSLDQYANTGFRITDILKARSI